MRACTCNKDVKKLAEENPFLTTVNLHGQLKITEVWPLCNLKQLQRVDISSTGVEFCPITLTKCPRLHHLNVSNTKVHTTTLASIVAATPLTLKNLRYESCSNVDEEMLRVLIKRGFYNKISSMMTHANILVAANIPRGPDVDQKRLTQYIDADIGPLWAKDVRSWPSHRQLQSQGCVCTGFINLIMRKAEIPLHHIVRPVDPPFAYFGLGGTDEWLFWWQQKVEPFDQSNRSYEKGTLLLRCWNKNDMGHIAIFVDDAGDLPLNRTIAHTLGIGENQVIKKETVESALKKMKTESLLWSASDEPEVPTWGPQFAVHFGTKHNGFTHVLRPQHWCVLGPRD